MFARLASALLRPARFVPLVVLMVSAAELAVADRKYGLFSGGFGQSSAVDSLSEIAIFAFGFALAQAGAALLGWAAARRIGHGRGEYAPLVHFAFIYGGLSLLALTLQYQLHSYFSDAVSFALLSQLGGGSAGDALLFAKNEIALGLAALAAFTGAWWLALRLVRRLPASSHSGTTASKRWFAAGWAALLLAVFLLPRSGSDGAHGLERILAWNAVSNVAARTSDFDRDGYGLAGRHIDAAPFDAARHPLALDIPGNGVDEDGYGGDLELVAIPQVAPDVRIEGKRPHVVVVVMESTRYDVLGKRIGGRAVAPHLEALVNEGSALAPVFSHVGFTTESLKSLFGGALTVAPGAPSLFRDFHRSGYRIGVFSGQPEDFGDISEAVGMRASADHFVDAEALKDQRAFSFAAQGSLLVDEAIVLGEFERALGRPEAWDRPNFVYLNFQSPHFPYHHDGVPHRLARPPVKRGEIGAANAGRVQATYWNAVAHADAALGRVVETLKAMGAWDDTLLLVTGDHGEALFEDGFLGHGHVINRRQNGTFLVANRKLDGLEGPLAQSDIRAVVLAALGVDGVDQPRQPPFMHIGPLDHPTAIGMADARHGVVSLRFDREEACFENRTRACFAYRSLSPERKAVIDHLVARWGSERWALARAGRLSSAAR